MKFLRAKETDTFIPCLSISLPGGVPRKSMSYLAKGKYHLSAKLYEIVSGNAALRSDSE